MEQKEMIDLLRQVASGTMDVEQAALKLKEEPFEDLGFAKIDHHRAMRQGVAEVIYGEGKTPAEIAPGTKVYELVEELAKYLPEKQKKCFD